MSTIKELSGDFDPVQTDASDAHAASLANLSELYAETYQESSLWKAEGEYPLAKRKRKYALPELEVISAKIMPSGVYYALNVWTAGANAARGIVTVKHRNGTGEKYLCLTCCRADFQRANSCLHIKCVQAYIETHPEVTT